MILIPPSSIHSASRPRPATAGLTTGYCIAAFTLIELMAATTVLSIILLMMVGMQDQMSKAWSNSNRRTDATREARAAASLMSADLTCPIFRAPTNSSSKDEFAGARKMGQVRSAAIRLSAARASRVASVLRLALDQAFDI